MNARIPLLSALLSIVCLTVGAQTPRMPKLTVRRASTPDVVVIPSKEITKSPPVFKPQTIEPQAPARRLALPGGASIPQSPNMGLQAAPKGKLNITLTPAKPAYFNLAYLKYEYPRSVYITTGTAYAEYSQQNVPGFFSYTLRLEKGKKYLLELTVTVEPGDKALAHGIGGQEAVHTIAGWAPHTISATIEPEDTGWVSGYLHQGNTNTPSSWRFYSLSVKEL